jgi:N-acylneuraminate cytidylyltransferase
MTNNNSLIYFWKKIFFSGLILFTLFRIFFLIISKIAKKTGAFVIKRPTKLCTDTSTTKSAIQHYINNCQQKPAIIILLQATSPLRPKVSLDDALKHFINGKYDSLLSICPAHRFFWRIKDDNTTYSEYDYLYPPRRQDLI